MAYRQWGRGRGSRGRGGQGQAPATLGADRHHPPKPHMTAGSVHPRATPVPDIHACSLHRNSAPRPPPVHCRAPQGSPQHDVHLRRRGVRATRPLPHTEQTHPPGGPRLVCPHWANQGAPLPWPGQLGLGREAEEEPNPEPPPPGPLESCTRSRCPLLPLPHFLPPLRCFASHLGPPPPSLLPALSPELGPEGGEAALLLGRLPTGLTSAASAPQAGAGVESQRGRGGGWWPHLRAIAAHQGRRRLRLRLDASHPRITDPWAGHRVGHGACGGPQVPAGRTQSP